VIFIASAEVKRAPGSQMKDRSVGASVYCLIPAASKSAGEAKLRACLEQDKYRLRLAADGAIACFSSNLLSSV
jgi:hypothetical protein